MRDLFRIQYHLDSIPVPEIKFPSNSRSRLYAILRSLQEIYPQRERILTLISNDIEKATKRRGPKGMTCWQLLILLALRTRKRVSYDDLEVEFNENATVRAMLELDPDSTKRFSSRTLSANYRKISSETIDKCIGLISDIALPIFGDDGKSIRADSFVCQTNIHFPTDQYLVYDAGRKVLSLGNKIFGPQNGWRQSSHLEKNLKTLAREVSLSKRGGGKGKATRVKRAYAKLIKLGKKIYTLSNESASNENKEHSELIHYSVLLEVAIDITWRRTQNNEKIENSEKLLSVFETHTQLINRGKIPLPIEFGHRVVVSQSISGMIVDFRVMDKGLTDRDETDMLIERLFKKFGKLKVCSVDKGYWYADIYETNEHKVELLVAPKKGKSSKKSYDREHEDSFIENRKWRSGVESLISALQRADGLDKCRDRGYEGYKRWVSSGVLQRNLITFGTYLLEIGKKTDKIAS